MVSFSDSKGSSSPKKIDVWNKQQKEIWQALAPQAYTKNADGTFSLNKVQNYPGSMYAALQPQEQSYLDAVNSAYTSDNMNARINAVNSVLGGKPAFEIDPAKTEQYFNESIYNPAMREFTQTTLPGVKEAFVGPGYWGSARANAVGTAWQNFNTEMTRQHGELTYADEQARRQALENAANRQATMAGSPQNAVSGMLSDMGTAGQYARQVEQERVAGDLQRWMMGGEVDGKSEAVYSPYIQLALAMLGLNQYAVGTASQNKSEAGGVFTFGSTNSGSIGG